MPGAVESAHKAALRVQGGTGKHVDGSIVEPLAQRPFQSLVMLSDPPTSPAADGSLRVLPGFHAAAARYFALAKLPAPDGGFTPLTDHDALVDEALWVPARRMPARWRALHAAGKLPPPCAAAQARGIDGLAKKLRGLAHELAGGKGADSLGPSEPAHAGDYVIWGACAALPRARHAWREMPRARPAAAVLLGSDGSALDACALRRAAAAHDGRP
jgi:hypothetical protein